MIYFLYGNNDYQIDQRANQLRQQFASKYGSDNVAVLDVNAVSPADIMTRLTAVSLFTQHQMVLVKAVTADKEAWTLLENHLDYTPDSTVVVLTDNQPVSKVNNLTRTKTFTKLKQIGATIEKFDILAAGGTRQWLIQELKRRDLEMDTPAREHFLQLTAGEDNQQARLSSELDKLALLQLPLTIETLDTYVEPSPATNAFAIFGMALMGQRDEVRKQLQNLRMSGEDANRFIGLLASQIMALAAAIAGAKMGINPYQLSQARQITSKLGSSIEQRRRLQHITTAMAELDATTKTAKPETVWLYLESTLARL